MNTSAQKEKFAYLLAFVNIPDGRLKGKANFYRTLENEGFHLVSPNVFSRIINKNTCDIDKIKKSICEAIPGGVWKTYVKIMQVSDVSYGEMEHLYRNKP